MEQRQKVQELAKRLGVPFELLSRPDIGGYEARIGEALFSVRGETDLEALDMAETYLRGLGCGLWLAVQRVSASGKLTEIEAVGTIWIGGRS